MRHRQRQKLNSLLRGDQLCLFGFQFSVLSVMSVMSVMVLSTQKRVKKWRRLRIRVAETQYFECGPVFDLFAYFFTGHVTLFGHLTNFQNVYQGQKKKQASTSTGKDWTVDTQNIPGLWQNIFYNSKIETIYLNTRDKPLIH